MTENNAPYQLERIVKFSTPHAYLSHSTVLRLIPIALVYGVLSGLRWPQTYTISHMVIDYHFGFGKRGLIGATLRLIDRPPYHYATLAGMAFAIFALSIFVFAVLTWRSVKSDTGIAAAVLLFFLSAGFSSLVCDIGRGEHFGLLLSLTCLLIPVGLPWLLVRVLLLTASVLVQEVNFLVFVPLVVFDVWLGSASRSRQERMSYVIVTLLPITVLTWFLGNLKTACNTPLATAYYQHMAANFTMQPIPVATLCMNGKANVQLVADALWSVEKSAWTVPLALVVAMPSALYNLLQVHRLLKSRRALVTISWVVTMAPLSLLVVAADVVRFVTMIQLTSLLVLVSAVQRIGLPTGGTCLQTGNRTAIATALLAFQLGSSLTLNDGNEMLKFPFTPLLIRALAIAEGHAPFVLIQ